MRKAEASADLHWSAVQLVRTGLHILYAIRRLSSAPGCDYVLRQWTRLLAYVCKNPYLRLLDGDLEFEKGAEKIVVDWTSDSDLAAERDHRCVTSKTVSINGIIAIASSAEHPLAVTSVGEAEVLASNSALKRAEAVAELIKSLGVFKPADVSVEGHVDNASSIEVSSGAGVLTRQSRHLKTRDLNLRRRVAEGMPLHHIDTRRNPSNFGTKALGKKQFREACEQLDICLIEGDIDLNGVRDLAYIIKFAVKQFTARRPYGRRGHGVGARSEETIRRGGQRGNVKRGQKTAEEDKKTAAEESRTPTA